MALQRLNNEAELLDSVSKGDEKAFSELFYAYYNQLGEFVQLLVRDTEATSEIVQEVFTKVWINRESLLSVRNFDAYLFILCRNHTLNHIRNRLAIQKKHSQYLREVTYIEEVEDANVWQDVHELVEKAIQLLPPQQQKVFVLRQQGLKNPEISRQMDISIESVKKYQHLALKFISEFVKTEVALSVILATTLVAN